MPIYEFRCWGCGKSVDRTTRTPTRCACGDTLHRVFSVNTPSPRRQFIPHFNNSVGRWVESNRHFDELLKQGSEAQSLATGIDHNYARVEAPDMVHTVSGEGIYEEKKAMADHRQGLRPKDSN